MNIDNLSVPQRIRILKWMFIIAEIAVIAIFAWPSRVDVLWLVIYVVFMTCVAIWATRMIVRIANRAIEQYERDQNKL